MVGSCREILQGILQYAQTKNDWNLNISIHPDALTPELVSSFERENVAGILLTELGTASESFATTSIPFVLMSSRPPAFSPKPDISCFISPDEADLGRCGAEYLYSLGFFASFGFVQSYPNTAWCELRKNGFVDAIRKHKRDAVVFTGPTTASALRPPGQEEDLRKLSDWLVKLPKPAAIMADHDWRATQILNVCRRTGIRIPDQISLLGVDNDILLCEAMKPFLSSIRPSHEQVGYAAAMALDQLLSKRKIKSEQTITTPKNAIVERESTRPLAPAGQLIQKARSFISQHACDGIGVADVVAKLGVSRSLAEYRFRLIEGKSILQTILEHRLNEVTRLLKTTQYPITRITLSCGFHDPKYLAQLFKKRFHCSMRKYRQMQQYQQGKAEEPSESK